MANQILFKIEITATARVDHHAPCVPWCTVCYPCVYCGIMHSLEIKHDQPTPEVSESTSIGTSTLNRDGA